MRFREGGPKSGPYRCPFSSTMEHYFDDGPLICRKNGGVEVKPPPLRWAQSIFPVNTWSPGYSSSPKAPLLQSEFP